MDFQVLGAALEASECSWRPLGALLRPLGALLRPLDASWRPLESVLCLPEEVLEASGARSSRHSAFPMDPGEGQELRTPPFFMVTTWFGAQGGRTTGGGNSTLAPAGLTAKHQWNSRLGAPVEQLTADWRRQVDSGHQGARSALRPPEGGRRIIVLYDCTIMVSP